MDQYIVNLLPRLFDLGKKLNKIESIVGKVWVKYGEDDYETYRFKRNNLVLISHGGQVEERKWELIEPNALYISKNGEGSMLRQAIVYEALLVMQMESKKFNPVIFYDEAKIPDGNIIKYLTTIFSANNPNKIPSGKNTLPLEFERKTYSLKRGEITIEYKSSEGSIFGGTAYKDLILADDGTFQVTDDPVLKSITVKNGIVINVTTW